MTRPTREEAVSTLEESHRAVLRLLAGLSEEQLARRGTIGGGEWSAVDVAGHLAHWEERALRSLEEFRAGRRPEVEDLFATDGIDRANAEDVAAKRALSPRDVLALADATHRRLVLAIRALPPDGWRARAPYETRRRATLDVLLGSVLGAPQRPFGHAFAHLPDLATYVSSLGEEAR